MDMHRQQPLVVEAQAAGQGKKADVGTASVGGIVAGLALWLARKPPDADWQRRGEPRAQVRPLALEGDSCAEAFAQGSRMHPPGGEERPVLLSRAMLRRRPAVAPCQCAKSYALRAHGSEPSTETEAGRAPVSTPSARLYSSSTCLSETRV